MRLPAGTRLGPYEILAPLGAGGMGEVYRARDEKLDRDVAIKVLPESVAANPEALARFEREAKAVAALSHPNILSIFDYGTAGSIVYAVMELLEGDTLRDKLNAGPVPRKQALDYALQIARGLSAAHEKGVVHRDLKPENLFVTRDGHLKIPDFGLAKRIEAVASDQTSAPTQSGHTEPGSGKTEPGTVMGTAGYMSPEQVRGLPVESSGVESSGVRRAGWQLQRVVCSRPYAPMRIPTAVSRLATIWRHAHTESCGREHRIGRPLRLQARGAVHHVIVRGNERKAIFRDDRDRQEYLDRLNRSRLRFRFSLFAYCLMTNHIHLQSRRTSLVFRESCTSFSPHIQTGTTAGIAGLDTSSKAGLSRTWWIARST